ncbi:hypothetical protein SprV_0100301000 [Sparganum proliferum]
MKPRLGDDEAVIDPTFGIVDSLRHQHFMSISPPDENVVQQVQSSRSGVHPGRHLRHRQAEEGVDQKDAAFCVGSQEKEEKEEEEEEEKKKKKKKEAVVIAVADPVETEHCRTGSATCLDAGVGGAKDN